MNEQATELEYLQWFFASADFGPADSDVRECMEGWFEKETGKSLPDGYSINEE